jgi:putative flippase GtrA
MKDLIQKIIFAKFSIFAIIGLFGLALNLSSFIIYLKFFSPTFASFLAFSTAVIFNYICHGKFLWTYRKIHGLKYQRFVKFYLGYSFSMIVNVSIVYFFQSYFENIILLQIIGIILGSLLNFFISRFAFTGRIN